MRQFLPVCLFFAWIGLLASNSAAEDTRIAVHNGFKLTSATVPVEEILPGGPPRDGIPALFDPQLLPASDAPWNDEEVVIGIELGGEARAYPLAILNWHELVNDTVGGRAILVSYCPLCGTGIVFDRSIGGRIRKFGVSGLLYRSDMLLYDHETDSLWSQIKGAAVTGEASGTRLRILRSDLTTWGSWRERHSNTTVLGLDTGHRRDYNRAPYAGYRSSHALYFPAPLDRRYHPKTPTLGIRDGNGSAVAYPADELVRAGGHVVDQFDGRRVEVTYDDESKTFDAIAPPELEVIEGFWFAWSAFHPETRVFTMSPEPSQPE